MDSLRERKKQVTRDALSWAALRMSVERGLENVRVEDIAAEAGVSARTFNNYFSSKQEAICSRMVDRAVRSAESLRERPHDEPLWTSITTAVVEQYRSGSTTGPTEQWVAGVRAVLGQPELQGEFLRQSLGAAGALAEAIAERTGTDPERDLYPTLVAGIVGACVNLCTDRWLHQGVPGPTLADLIEEALGRVAAGLPTP